MHNTFCMVAVEHFSKHVELVPLPNKEAKTTAAAFAAAVLGRYGCPAEVLTDQGSEWEEQFQQMLLDCMIDHRRTSAHHPQADGLAERCVATVKRALSKLCAAEGSQLDWDRHLPWLMLGYNCSPSKATGLSPYQLMHAVTPTVPPSIRERMDEPVDLDDPERAAADFLHRSQLVKERCVMAGDNLKVAQHRDTLRYAKLRSGNYTPQLRRFMPGDYVYVRKHDKLGLDIGARQAILRVSEVRPSGVLILQGRCGTYSAVHSSHCAPCHLPNIDPTIDWSLGKPPAEAVCEQCGDDSEDVKGRLIFCDNCNSGWHLACHRPVLSHVPKGTWVCSRCEGQGITLDAVKAMQVLQNKKAAEQLRLENYTKAELRSRAVHGRLLKKFFPGSAGLGRPASKGGLSRQQVPGKWFIGKVWFRGPRVKDDLAVVYEDGDVEFTTLSKLRLQQVEWLPEDAVDPPGVTFKTLDEAHAELERRQQELLSHGARVSSRARRRSAAASVSLLAAPEFATAAAQATPCLPDDTEVEGTPILSYIHNPVLTLPGTWQLSSPAVMHSALQTLMPGFIATKDVTRLANVVKANCQLVKAGTAQLTDLGFVPMARSEVQVLLDAVDFSGFTVFYDPFAGSGTVVEVFADAGCKVVDNDVNPVFGCSTAVDALQPYTYDWLAPQVIVSSPPFELLDIAAPLMVAKAGVVACIHVPGHWLSNPRAARQVWLQQLADQGRLHIIMGLPRAVVGRRCAWVLVFSSCALRQQMLTAAAAPLSFTYAGH
jgi:hypothetical protein